MAVPPVRRRQAIRYNVSRLRVVFIAGPVLLDVLAEFTSVNTLLARDVPSLDWPPPGGQLASWTWGSGLNQLRLF